MNQNKMFSDAVVIVQKEISPDSARIIRFSFHHGESQQRTIVQAGFGIAVRNLLARHGIVWEEAVLFSVWFAILQKAVESVAD
jgi:hypothetical protein